jgi:cytochrome oxidase Cu insertion factor (SCO1/SenC/PrrC family)
MRPRFALLALLAALVLVVAGCGGDPAPDPGAAPATTAWAAPKATVPPATRQARPQTTTRPAPQGLVPAGQREPAPDLRVTDFDGRTITLGGLRGQPVVVNFFESW